MLQKPKTKFGYAHRILALPLVFAVAFVYMVNAKNKEIKETNKAIAIAVADLKKDTIKPTPKVDEMLKLNEEKIAKATEKLNKENEKIKALAEETKKKAEELKKIQKEKGTENAEYNAKLKEIETLGNKIDKVANEHRLNAISFYNGEQIDIDKFFKDKNSIKSFEMDKETLAKLQSKFNIKKWIDSTSINGKNIYMFNKAFDSAIINKYNGKNPTITAFTPNSLHLVQGFSVESAQKQAEIAAKKAVEAQKLASNASKNAKKDAKKNAELAKERARIATERAELARKQAELIKQEAELNKKDPNLKNAPWILGVGAYSPKTTQSTYSATSSFKPNSEETVGSVLKVIENSEKEGKTNLLTQDLVVYIDGKKSTYAEAKKLDTRKIKSINVIKANGENTMRIELK